MKNMRTLLILLISILCLLMLSSTAGATMPETIRFKSANFAFGAPCPEPPDLGFDPLDSYSETIDLMSPQGKKIGSGSLCHFVKSYEGTPDNWIQINKTSGIFSFSDGTLNFDGYVRYKGLPNGTLRVKMRGDIIDGTETYSGVQGKAMAGGKVLFEGEIPIPNILFVFRFR